MKRSVLVLASLALLLWGGSWMTACGAAGSGAGNTWLDRVLLTLAFLGGPTSFNGSRFCNSEEFTLEYEILGGTDTWELRLAERDILQVDLVVDTGNLAVVIEGPDGNVFYEDDDAETETFELEITEGGRYAVSVTGTDTRGSVSFKKAAAE